MTLSLKNVLTGHFLLASIIPCLAIGLISSYLLNRSLSDEAARQATQLSNLASQEVYDHLQHPLEDLEEIGDLLNEGRLSGKELQRVLEATIRTHQHFARIQLMDRKGIVTNSAPLDKQIVGIDCSRQKFFSEPLKNLRPYWSDTELSPSLNTPCVTVSIPIRDGVITGFLSLQDVSDFFERLELPTGNLITLSDSHGAYIVHPNTQKVKIRERDPFSLLPISSGQTEMISQSVTIDGASYQARISRIANINWTLGVFMSEQLIYAPVNRLLWLTISAIALVLLISASIAYLQSRGVVLPLQRLLSSTKVISDGDYSVRLSETGFVELSELARQFNTMATSIRTREIQLSEREKDLQTILNSIGDGIIVTDAQGVILRLNPAAESLLGLNPGEANGTLVSEKLQLATREEATPVDLHEEVLSKENEVTRRDNLLLTNQQGSICEVSATGTPVLSEQGGTVGTVMVLHDVSEQRDLERQFRQVQKMDMIGQLAGGIAHDFNNMLLGIMGANELLAAKHGGSDDVSEQLFGVVATATERAADLTRKLLDFSRKGKRDTVPVDIHKIVKESVVLLSRSIDKKISIKSHLNASKTTVLGDPAQLQNVLINLGVNARDAMPDGGTLTIATSDRYIDDEYCQQHANELESGEYIEVTVRDTGCGMDKETVSHIFEPFYTTKEVGKGTGLGLSSVYGTIKDHHGSVTVYSETEKGTLFRVLIPIAGSGTNPMAAEQLTDIPLGSGTVLFVDDEDIARDLAQVTIRELGYDVIVASNGLEAVQMYEEQQDLIDLVVLDLIMPELDGMSTFLRLMELNSKVRVVVSSGFSRSEEPERMLLLGAKAFVQKPYTKANLAKALHLALKGT